MATRKSTQKPALAAVPPVDKSKTGIRLGVAMPILIAADESASGLGEEVEEILEDSAEIAWAGHISAQGEDSAWVFRALWRDLEIVKAMLARKDAIERQVGAA